MNLSVASVAAYWDELEKIAKPKKPRKEEGPESRHIPPLIAVAGNTALAIPMHAIINAKHPDHPHTAKLREFAKKVNVPVDFHPNPHFNIITKRVGIPDDVHPSILAHELGHATGGVGKKVLQALYPLAMQAGAPAMVLGSGAALALGTNFAKAKTYKQKVEQIDRAKAGTAALTALYSPVLLEEGRASARGLKYMYDAGGVRALPGAMGRLGLAYGTYASLAAAPAVAIHLLNKRKSKLDKAYGHSKHADAASRRKARRWAGAIAGGAAGTGIGYLLGRLLSGKTGKLNPRTLALLSAASGLTGSLLSYRMGAYANEPPPRARRELRDLGTVQPKNGELAQRHKGHPDQVLSGRVPPAASGSERFSFRTGSGGRVGVDGRKDHRADHFRRGSSEYGFSGKKARDYHFQGPLRVR